MSDRELEGRERRREDERSGEERREQCKGLREKQVGSQRGEDCIGL